MGLTVRHPWELFRDATSTTPAVSAAVTKERVGALFTLSQKWGTGALLICVLTTSSQSSQESAVFGNHHSPCY